MSLLAKLKSVLGIDTATGPATTTDVPVQREGDASSERAVKGVEAGPDATVDTPGSGTTEAAEVSGGAGDAAAAAADGEPVEAIKGIGTAYAERLAEAGVHTVEDLAAADAEDLAERTGLGAGRVGNWIERAGVRER